MEEYAVYIIDHGAYFHEFKGDHLVSGNYDDCTLFDNLDEATKIKDRIEKNGFGEASIVN